MLIGSFYLIEERQKVKAGHNCFHGITRHQQEQQQFL